MSKREREKGKEGHDFKSTMGRNEGKKDVRKATIKMGKNGCIERQR